MNLNRRVIMAMSGGVDSSVAAARLVDAGYEVVGVTLHLWDYKEKDPDGKGRCCAPEDQYDAKRVADKLRFAHYTFDRRSQFREFVVDPFVEAYASGTTPSPCASCNQFVKLRELFILADKFGAEFVATGHYARTDTLDGNSFIKKGLDPRKDQSYFLYSANQEQIRRLIFPIGESLKADVRLEAKSRNLPGADKGESQDLCFVESEGHAKFVENSGKKIRPGPIVDSTGKVVGQHLGIHNFTVGQKKGLGVSLGYPAYVTGVDAVNGTVKLGKAEELECKAIRLESVITHPGAKEPFDAIVKIRYNHSGEFASIIGSEVHFKSNVRAVAQGQIAVFYDQDRVLGGGKIVGAV